MALQIIDSTTQAQRALTTAEQAEVRTGLGLGTAATTAATAYATAAQGAAADTAVQPGGLKTINGQSLVGVGAITISGGGGGDITAAQIADSTAAGRAVLTAADAAAQRAAMGLGTAATTAASAYATAAQGAVADTALQPGILPAGTTIPLAQVTGAGTAAAENTSAFATAAQGVKADTAIQPGVIPAGTTIPLAQVTGAGTAAAQPVEAFATAGQGAKADAALPATADAIADVLEAAATGAPADLARIQASVSGVGITGPAIFGLFGDSRLYASHITDGGTSGVTYPAQETATTRDDLNVNGLAHHLQVVSGGAIICPRSCNYAIAGQRTWEMLARVDVAIAGMRAAGAVGAVMLMSTNDRGAAGITHVDSIANISAIRDKFFAAGMMLAIIAEEPRGDTGYVSQRLSPTLLQEHMMVRKAIMGMHSPSRRIFAVDAWNEIALLSSATGDARTGYTYDGLHKNGVMAQKVARKIWRDHLSKVIPEYSWRPASNSDLWSATNTKGSINYNPCVVGTAGTLGGLVGVLADAWTGGSAVTNLTVTGSKGTDSNTGAEYQQFDLTSSGSVANLAVIDLMRRDSSVGSFGLAVGGKVRAVAEIEILAGHAGIHEIDLYVGSGSLNCRAGSSAPSVADTMMQVETLRGLFITEPLTIPTGATSVRIGVRAYFKAGNPAGTVRVRWCNLEHVA